MSKDTIKSAVVVTAAFVVGGVSGYFFARKRLEKKYAIIANEEIASVMEASRRFRKDGPFSTPEGAADALLKDGLIASGESYANAVLAMRRYNGEEVDEEQVENIFDTPDFSEEELGEGVDVPQDPDKPYLISVDKFMENDNDFDQITVKYYEGDDQLTDDADGLVEDVERTVGLANLQKFGQSDSKDRNVVYVRNERLGADFEICRDPGSYSHLVLGVPEKMLEEDKPVRKRPVRKMRDDD